MPKYIGDDFDMKDFLYYCDLNDLDPEDEESYYSYKECVEYNKNPMRNYGVTY